jgi:decaprenyl-phosphate phosphoribosyltransferase
VTTTATRTRGPLRALFSAMRPEQWVKNLLIGVAPVAAGMLTDPDVVRHTAAAFLSFCALSSAVYLTNDVRDAESDRQHPTKQHRAIASGQLSARRALSAAAVLAAIAFILPAFLWHPGGLYLVLGIYVATSASYTLGMKHVAVVELAFVASGFFLRAYAGAVASHIYVSPWFLVVISFGALFLVVGKRSSELMKIGRGATRRVLAEYTPEFLHSALTMSATVTVTTYCLWAIDTSSTGLSSAHHHIVPIRLTVVPVVLATLFIIRSAEAGDGHSPEDLLLHNRTVQILAVIWAALVMIGVYA